MYIDAIISACLYLEAISEHATLVFRNEVLTLLLWVRAGREKHTFITGRFFVLADATGLYHVSQLADDWQVSWWNMSIP